MIIVYVEYTVISSALITVFSGEFLTLSDSLKLLQVLGMGIIPLINHNDLCSFLTKACSHQKLAQQKYTLMSQQNVVLVELGS